MDKSMKWKIAAAAAILLGILFAAVAIYLIPRLYDLSVEAAFSYDASVSDLPLTGYAPSAEEDYAEETQLVFINMTWAEWEPEEG